MYIFEIEFVKQPDSTPGYMHLYNTVPSDGPITQTIAIKISLATLIEKMDVPPYEHYSSFTGIDTKYESILTAFIEIDKKKEMTGNLILLGYCEEEIELGQCIKLTI